MKFDEVKKNFQCYLCKRKTFLLVKLHLPIAAYEIECECGHIGLIYFDQIKDHDKYLIGG